MARYELEVKPGYDESVARDRPNIKNSVIWKKRGDKKVDWFPATRRNIQKLEPRKPGEESRGEKLVMGSGFREIQYRKPKDKLERGINPFFQLIYMVGRTEDFLSFGDIYRAMTKDYGVLHDEEFCRVYLKSIIDEMRERGHIFKDRKGYTVKVPLDGERSFVDYDTGYDPITKKIYDYVDGKGGTSRKETREYIMDYLGFVEKSSTLEFYINEMKREKEEYIHFGKDKLISEKDGWLETVGKLGKND